ncbi:MAG: hypothetical protein A2X59_05975 [Nitrospirae bacterium GWC2_42_7]|nr:MAG: hypothetical protein A2X59_05975 [Nitrospirae bacterium GWC2_42_7]
MASVIKNIINPISASIIVKKIPRKSASVESWLFANDTIAVMPPPNSPRTKAITVKINTITIKINPMKRENHIRGKNIFLASAKNPFMLNLKEGSIMLLPMTPTEPPMTYKYRVVAKTI